jgi:ribonuclease BN (tRNA processing enzyme)
MTTGKVSNTKQMNSDKYFFASYLNMARHNVYLVLNDVAALLKKSPLNDDGRILSSSVIALFSNANSKDDEVLKAQELLCRKFPFMESLMDEYLLQTNRVANQGKSKAERVKLKEKADKSDYFDLFKLLFEQLNESRNEFTHVYKPTTIFNNLLLQLLKRVYDDSVTKTKEQFTFSSEEVEHLRRKMANPDRKSKQKTIEKTNFKYAFEKNEQITQNGLAFFICLFLEKKYAYLFLKQLEGFKEGRTNAARATLETFCAFSIKIPNLRIESTFDENLLYMDMINELKRCPSQLYEHLSSENQKRFKIKIEEKNANDELHPEAVLKRHDDRFTYFVMRYIDELELFKDARFMLDLGNYNFEVYDKAIDGEMRIRRLNKKLTTFGRLQDFSIEKMEEHYGKDLLKYSSEVEEDCKEKYIAKTFPHYHYDESNVGIMLSHQKIKPFPDLNNATAKGSPRTFAPDVWKK